MRDLIAKPGRSMLAALALNLTAMTTPTVSTAGVTHAQAAANPAISLRWDVTSLAPGKTPGRAFAHATFTLTNTGSEPVPATGWWIYFNIISGARSLPDDSSVIVENVAGSLFRMRPASQNAPIPPGKSLSLNVEHPDAVMKNSKGPTGPYIVFDSTPEVGQPISNFVSTPFPRMDKLPGLPDAVSSRIGPEETFAQNARIATVAEEAVPLVLPRPAQVSLAAGHVRLSPATTIKAARALSHEAKAAQHWLSTLPAADASAPALPLKLKIANVPGQTSPESYQLVVDAAKGVTITGKSPAGVFYGLMSLAQLGPDAPAATITDAPRFGYRGLMLDVSRNFQSKDKVLQVLDLMARFKLNRLHLHFADDEGWRIEIKGLPELTKVGARRGHSTTGTAMLPPAYGSGPDPRDPHGSGFYSQADYMEILRRAKALHIEVIPELEMPGHARAAVKAMEARYQRLLRRGAPHPDAFLLNDLEDQSRYRSAQLFRDNVINPGKPGVYAFIDKVVGQLAAMHRKAGAPLRTLHVGADELAVGAWERSRAAHAEMKRIGAATTADLWDHFYDQVDAIAQRHGAHLAGWEELGVRKVIVNGQYEPAPNPHFTGRPFLLHVWNNLEGSEDLAYQLANAGFAVVLSPATNLYFDMAHSHDALEPGHNWAAYVELSDVFDFDPLDMNRSSRTPGLKTLSPSAQGNIAGIEGTLFSETMRDPTRLDYMMTPRMFALAERAWSKAPDWTETRDPEHSEVLRKADWSAFSALLGQRVLPMLDQVRPDLAYRIPPPGLLVQEGRVLANHAYPSVTLRYTVGGAAPDASSRQVFGPIADKGLITVTAFSRNGRAGRSASIENP